jgi:hypothetical protein
LCLATHGDIAHLNPIAKEPVIAELGHIEALSKLPTGIAGINRARIVIIAIGVHLATILSRIANVPAASKNALIQGASLPIVAELGVAETCGIAHVATSAELVGRHLGVDAEVVQAAVHRAQIAVVALKVHTQGRIISVATDLAWVDIDRIESAAVRRQVAAPHRARIAVLALRIGVATIEILFGVTANAGLLGTSVTYRHKIHALVDCARVVVITVESRLAFQAALGNRTENTGVGAHAALAVGAWVPVIAIPIVVTALRHGIKQASRGGRVTAQIGAGIVVQDTVIGARLARLSIAIGGISKG